jgi:hypothetical protein
MLFRIFRRKTSEKSAEKPRKRGRPTREMAAERRLQKLKDAETELKLLEIERKKKELLAGEGEKHALTHEDVLRVVEYLRELGLEVRSKGGGRALDDAGLRGILREIADSKLGASLGEALAVMVAGKTPMLAAPPVPEPTPPAPTETPAQEAAPVDPSLIIIQQLQNRSPDDAADWLLARREPQAKVLARTFANTPDEQLFELLDDYASQAPGLVRWLRSRPEWTIGMVHALRSRMGIGQGAARDVGL